MLTSVIKYLSCPHDGSALAWTDDVSPRSGATVGCEAGHRFDVARQGYVNLLTRAAPAAADTAAMVAARMEVVGAGHFHPLTEELVDVVHEQFVLGPPVAATGAAPQTGEAVGAEDAAAESPAVAAPVGRRRPTLIVDVGAGPGHHLAGVVDGTDAAAGLAIDLSKHAARRAARAHERIGAVVADAWATLPVIDAAADVVLVVFAPRQATELARLLRPDGRLLIVTPRPGHLDPLVERLGLLQAAQDKTEALDRSLDGIARCVDRRELRWTRGLTHAQVAPLVLMGPSAHHLDVAASEARISRLPDPIEVAFAVTVSTYRPQ